MKFGRKLKYLIISTSIILFCTIGCKKSGPVEPYKPPCPPIEIVPPSPYDSPIWHPSDEFIGFNHTPLRKIHYPFGEHCQGEYEFASDSTGFWLINPDGTNKRRIFPYRLHSPAWSPDGNWIAFVVFLEDERHIFKMRFTGTTFDTTTLSQLTFAGRNFFPAWSPDGKWIAYDRSLADASGPAGVWIMKPDGTQKRSVFGGAFPAWHPNGQSLLAVIGTSPTSIWTRFVRYYPLQTVQPETLSAVVGNDNRNPKYSPDGTRIAFWSSPFSNIWIMMSDGTNLKQLTQDGVDATFGRPFSWSPSGERIVYTHYRTDDWTYANGVLWIVNVSTLEKRQLTFNTLPTN